MPCSSPFRPCQSLASGSLSWLFIRCLAASSKICSCSLWLAWSWTVQKGDEDMNMKSPMMLFLLWLYIVCMDRSPKATGGHRWQFFSPLAFSFWALKLLVSLDLVEQVVKSKKREVGVKQFVLLNCPMKIGSQSLLLSVSQSDIVHFFPFVSQPC